MPTQGLTLVLFYKHSTLVLAWVSSTLGIAMSSLFGDIVMRIISKRQLRDLVPYSPQHIARLEKAGKFPKRVQLGPNRVGWVEEEVQDWLVAKAMQRE